MTRVTRGFRGRRQAAGDGALPPGQYVTDDFPVFSAGPTPHTPLEEWSFAMTGEVAGQRVWTWEQFEALPAERIVTDVHCVTRWSKLGTAWRGVSVDVLLAEVEYEVGYATAFCDGGYTTNLALDDLTGGKAWIACKYDDRPLEPEHGAPARLLVPHLYLWKSAKWVRGLRLTEGNEPGFWESLGYHERGDPWQEQRHWGD
jgi:DMSO/TMAO reductase YedYZ molybdopterin-dependent catalytic subunit